MTQDEQKRLAAEAALEALRPTLGAGVVLGIGTGSTTNCFIDALGPLKDQFDGAVASSVASARRLEGHGIRVLSLQESGPLALYIDGADEADPNLALIKGGGAALTQEKIVASAAETFYCLVDESKCVNTLGAFPLPIEYIELAEAPLRRALGAQGAEATRRPGVITDNGHPILDVRGLDLRDPAAQERVLNQWPGVVCNGLFALRRADQLFVASPRGVTVKTAPR